MADIYATEAQKIIVLELQRANLLTELTNMHVSFVAAMEDNTRLEVENEELKSKLQSNLQSIQPANDAQGIA